MPDINSGGLWVYVSHCPADRDDTDEINSFKVQNSRDKIQEVRFKVAGWEYIVGYSGESIGQV
jgi:hypothetical protein